MKAKSDPKIGYRKRMKNLWDKIQPKLTFFSAKNFRDQASRVEKNRVAIETKYRIDKNQDINNVVNNDNTKDNSIVISEHLTTTMYCL